MTEDPTVELETGEEIDWLRHGRHGMEPAEATREATYEAAKELLQGTGHVEAEAPDPDAVQDAYDAFTDAVNMDADTLQGADLPEDTVKPGAVRDRVVELLRTPQDDWDAADAADARTVAALIGAVRDADDADQSQLLPWGYDPDA